MTSSLASLPAPPTSSLSKITIHPYSPDESQLPCIVALIETELSEPYIIYTYRYFLHQWPHLCFLAYAEDEDDETERDGDEPTASRTSVTPLLAGASLGDSQSTAPLQATAAAATDDDDDDDASSTLSTPSSLSSTSSTTVARAKPRGTPVGVVISKQDRHTKGHRLERGYIAMLSVHPSWRGRGIGKALATLSISLMVSQGAQEIVLETETDNVSSLALYERLGFVREKRLFRFYLNGKDSFRLVLPVPSEMGIVRGQERGDDEGEERDGIAQGTRVSTRPPKTWDGGIL